jgi:transcriptional regulator with XRE-family HTH domain
MTFAERLKKLRLERGLSQKEVANMVNVAQPTYWKYEHGSVPYKNTQIQLAKVFEMTVDELINGKGE